MPDIHTISRKVRKSYVDVYCVSSCIVWGVCVCLSYDVSFPKETNIVMMNKTVNVSMKLFLVDMLKVFCFIKEMFSPGVSKVQ